MHANYSLDKMINSNDTERLAPLALGNIEAAKKVAMKNFDNSTMKKVNKQNKSNCDADICVIFPVDELHGYADKMVCEKGCSYHVRCEGIIKLDEDERG